MGSSYVLKINLNDQSVSWLDDFSRMLTEQKNQNCTFEICENPGGVTNQKSFVIGNIIYQRLKQSSIDRRISKENTGAIENESVHFLFLRKIRMNFIQFFFFAFYSQRCLFFYPRSAPQTVLPSTDAILQQPVQVPGTQRKRSISCTVLVCNNMGAYVMSKLFR